MRDNKAIGIAAGFVIVGSALATGLSLSGGWGPHFDAAPYEEVGRVLARQTLTLLKSGGHVTVITRDTVTFQNPAADLQLASLRRELAKAGVNIDSVQALQIEPLRPMIVPPGDFFQWIKNAAKGDVLVSLMGPPMLTDAQLASLGPVKPAIVAFCSGPARDQVDLRGLFSQGLLQAAVVSKRPGETKPVVTGGEHEQFDRRFVEVTAGNLAALSTVSVTPP